jgi:hypothetical protein
MSKNIVAFCLLVILLFTYIAFVISHPGVVEIRYDCSWAEINPDIPPYVRERCRELRAHKYER